MSAVLVSKPTPISFSSAQYAHRRHPSAPVVVQPTRTPGVFSIKQKALTPARHQPSAQRQNNGGSKPAAKSAKALQTPRPLSLTPAPTINDKKPFVPPTMQPATPTPQSRGRAHAKSAKDKAQAYSRSPSNSSVRGKHGRQPSPPIATVAQSQVNQTPSQAEVSIISTNNFDPFLDSPSTSLISPPPSPTLVRPSGSLARRRQTQSAESLASPSPAHSKAIPVPSAAKRLHFPSLSRSDPVPSHIQHPRPIPKRSSSSQDFPICDDLNEVAGGYPPSPPSTPSRHSHGGPRTAPISARTPIGFPFANLEMPSPSRSNGGKRHHRRVPSEGVFNMSSDEDVSSGPEGTVLNTTLFGLLNVKRTPAFSTPAHSRPLPRSREQSPSYGSLTKEQQLEREAAEKAGYFASSMFQNSPSPEELPDPLLL